MNPILFPGKISILLFILWNFLALKPSNRAIIHLSSQTPFKCLSQSSDIQYSGAHTICAEERTGTFSVLFQGTDPNLSKPIFTAFVINEIEVDNAGSDTAEFVEILGPPDSSLSGFILVFFNGSTTAPPNASYRVIDLDRFRTDTCGYFLVRGPGIVDPHPTTGSSDTLVSIIGGFIQNGPDAVAIYHKPTYSNNTAPTLIDLADVIVYHNSTGSVDTNLLVSLGTSPQWVDNLASALVRIPDGTGLFVKDSSPTPGSTNSGSPPYSYLWLLTQGDSIVQVISGMDSSGYPSSFLIIDTGNYMVYGLSTVDPRDSFVHSGFYTIGQLQIGIQNGYCGSLSNQSIPITTLPPFRFIDFQTGTCSSFDSLGTYQLRLRWSGPIIHPTVGPDFHSQLGGDSFVNGDTVIFISNPISGGDTLWVQLADPYCGDTLMLMISQFCNYCSLMQPPDSLANVGICANDPFFLSPTGGGVEQTKPTVDLFFSEYIEGSANNKCLEIFNGTGHSIDLGLENYRIEIYFNGQAIPLSLISLNGVVATGQTFVICHNLSDTSFSHRAHQTSSSMDFNGDDALVLKHGIHTIDIIGQIGLDPGTQWGSGLASTQDNTLIRNKFIFEGDTMGEDPFIPSVEWSGHAQNEHSNLGQHEYKATIFCTYKL